MNSGNGQKVDKLGLGLGLAGSAQGLRQRAAVAVQAGLCHREIEGLAPRRASLGQAHEQVGHGLGLLADVEGVAVAGLVAPRSRLTRAQSGARVGDGVVRIEPLGGGIKQVNAQGVGVTVLDALQQIAVGRARIDAGEHRPAALEYLVVQAPTRTPDRSCAWLMRAARFAACTTQLWIVATPTDTPNRSRSSSTT